MPWRMPNWKMRAKALRRGRADDEALQDADARMRLHDAHEAQDRLARHQAVGVERQHQVVVRAPALAEIAQVAGLEAGVVGAAAIDDALRLGDVAPPGGDGGLLGRGDLRDSTCRSG